MGSFLSLLQPFVDWWDWTVATALAFDRTVLYAMVAGCFVTGLVLAWQLRQVGFVGRIGLAIIVAVGLCAICLALSHVSPVFFNPEDLARSQVPR